MADEWKSISLGEVATLQRGFDLPAQERLPGKVPIVSSSGVSGYHAKAVVAGPGVVTGRYGTIGQVFLINEDYWPLNTTLWVKDFHGNHPRFVYYLLKTIDFKSCSDKSSVPGVNRNDLHQLLVRVPPYYVQRKIACILGALDDKIELNRRMNATLEEIARALFKSWFVDFDPVRAKQAGKQPSGMDAETAALFPDAFEESELGEVPRGWRVESIKDVVEAVFDGPHATPKESDTGPIYLGIKNLTGSSLNLNEIRHISEEDWPDWTKRVTPQAGDIVFSYEATLGFFAIIPSDLRCCLGRRLALVRPYTTGGYGHFWFMQFISDPFQQYLKKHSVSGATVDRIPLVDFPKYRVLSPPEPIVKVFDDKASSFWQKINSNLSQANSLALLRDTLLPKLLSGEISVADAEEEAGKGCAS